jgi:hypothetical protein
MTDQDRSSSEAKESSFARLPNYPNNPFVISEIACQGCEDVRPGTKCYAILHMVCLYYVYARIDHHVKCPSCMRWFLVKRIPLSLLLANVLSPIILVWWTVQFVRTFSSLERTES